MVVTVAQWWQRQCGYDGGDNTAVVTAWCDGGSDSMAGGSVMMTLVTIWTGCDAAVPNRVMQG